MIDRSPGRKYLLPEEHRQTYAQHHCIQEGLKVQRKWLFLLCLIPVSITVVKSLETRVWFTFTIPAVISSLFGFLLWHSLVTGANTNNHGTFSRRLRPLGYWCSILILFLGY